MTWSDRQEVIKGTIGERIVSGWLDAKGLTIYEPITNGPHGFDKLVSLNKKNLAIVEVKTKPRRKYYPDTGINYRHYQDYLKVSRQHEIPVCLFFVDELFGQIYCGWLKELSKPIKVKWEGKDLNYPLVKSGIIYFYQPQMKVIHELTQSECLEIRTYTNNKYLHKID